MSMTFDIKKVARRNLKLLKFQQQKTKEDLHQRVKRVNYQAFVWKNPLKAKQEIPEADNLVGGVIAGTMSMCQYLSASSLYRYLQIQRRMS